MIEELRYELDRNRENDYNLLIGMVADNKHVTSYSRNVDTRVRVSNYKSDNFETKYSKGATGSVGIVVKNFTEINETEYAMLAMQYEVEVHSTFFRDENGMMLEKVVVYDVYSGKKIDTFLTTESETEEGVIIRDAFFKACDVKYKITTSSMRDIVFRRLAIKNAGFFSTSDWMLFGAFLMGKDNYSLDDMFKATVLEEQFLISYKRLHGLEIDTISKVLFLTSEDLEQPIYANMLRDYPNELHYFAVTLEEMIIKYKLIKSNRPAVVIIKKLLRNAIDALNNN